MSISSLSKSILIEQLIWCEHLLRQNDEHIVELEAQVAESESERHEQARLLGMSAERELSLRARLEEARELLTRVLISEGKYVPTNLMKDIRGFIID